MDLTRNERKIIKEAFKLGTLEHDLLMFSAFDGRISDVDRKMIRAKIEAMANRKGFSYIGLEEDVKKFRQMIDDL